MKRKFNIDEVVWAKIKGFPWWPASVSLLLFSSRDGRSADDSEKISKLFGSTSRLSS